MGVLTMAGKGVRVLVTPTSDLGKILACIHGLLLNFYIVIFHFTKLAAICCYNFMVLEPMA